MSSTTLLRLSVGASFLALLVCLSAAHTVIECPEVAHFQHAFWTATVENKTRVGTCLLGYKGHPTRFCNLGGTWNNVIHQPCIRKSSRPSCYFSEEGWRRIAFDWVWSCLFALVFDVNQPTRFFCFTGKICKALPKSEQASWAASKSLETHFGLCLSGFVGKPYRNCLGTGKWGPVHNPCVRNTTRCPEEASYCGASWPATYVTVTATGACLPGKTSVGIPTRLCKDNGTWYGKCTDKCT